MKRLVCAGMKMLAVFTLVWLCMDTFASPDALAASTTAPSGTCTTDPQFNPDPPASGGIVSSIVQNVKDVLDNMAQAMFITIAGNSQFRQAAIAAMTLYVAVYGILFTLAMVQMTLFDFAKRMIKFGIVALLISGGAWGFFSSYVVTFFNDGTDEIIAQLTSMTVAGIVAPVTPGSNPFVVLDAAIAYAMSAKMAVTLLAIFFTGPYGLVFGLMLLAALGSFVKSLLMAIWVYLMSLVVRTLLFGIAPFFLVCIMFDRTYHLFQGWLNQIINACLQPIFLFAFYAFFIKLIESALYNILAVPVCWTESMESIRGTPFSPHYWRFTHMGEPYGGTWGWGGTDAPGAPIFPIDIMTVLIFLVLAELASRFNSVALMIARDIANATTSLATMEGFGSEMMSAVTGRKGSAPGEAAGKAVNAGGFGAGGSVPRAGGAYTGAGGAAGAAGPMDNIASSSAQATAMTGLRS